MHTEIIDLGGTDISGDSSAPPSVEDGDGELSLLANADMYRYTRDKGHQLFVGRDANTNMPFSLPSWGHQSPIGQKN